MKFVQAPLLASIFAASTLVGCASWGDVNVAYRMDSGLEPEHIDEHVRFRTTYYFRVVEGCPIEPLSLENQASDSSLFVKRIKGNFAPQSDSLYRFRMTGQSAALFNKIHFESGVLRKEQIDPFGSGVRFNQDTNSFIPVSADDLRAETKRASTLQDITRMRGLLQEFKDDTNLTETQRTAFNTKLQAIIETRIEALHATPPGAIPGTPISTKGSTSAPPNNPGVTIPATPLSQDKPEDTKKAKSKDSTPAAPNNPGPATLAAPLSQAKPEDMKKPKEKGANDQEDNTVPSCNGKPSLKKYYLLGPEGTKELDPSDRLLMALSVDSKPLLGMLQQLSEYKLQSHESTLKVMEELMEERGRVFDAHRTLLKANEDLFGDSGPSDTSRLESLLQRLQQTFTTPTATTSK